MMDGPMTVVRISYLVVLAICIWLVISPRSFFGLLGSVRGIPPKQWVVQRVLAALIIVGLLYKILTHRW